MTAPSTTPGASRAPFHARPLQAGLLLTLVAYLPSVALTVLRWLPGSPSRSVLLALTGPVLALLPIIVLTGYCLPALRPGGRAAVAGAGIGAAIAVYTLPSPWSTVVFCLALTALCGMLAVRHLGPAAQPFPLRWCRDGLLALIPIPVMLASAALMYLGKAVLPPPGPRQTQMQALGITSEPVLLASIVRTSVMEEAASALLALGLRRRGMPVWAIVAINAVVRAAVHVYMGGGAFGPVLMSVTMTLLILRYQRLWPLIVSHVTYNLAVSHLPPHATLAGIAAITLGLLAALAVRAARRIIGRRLPRPPQPDLDRPDGPASAPPGPPSVTANGQRPPTC
ncbi:lysostaphin resistance A-like protein [Spongiactinospora sp. 9N601]|uniref:lysostaphin resistance A-like protein n=1 Tax=Spongiactinospora sp. 9N601 TaxID=3375149 RepID=UPI0037B37548